MGGRAPSTRWMVPDSKTDTVQRPVSEQACSDLSDAGEVSEFLRSDRWSRNPATATRPVSEHGCLFRDQSMTERWWCQAPGSHKYAVLDCIVNRVILPSAQHVHRSNIHNTREQHHHHHQPTNMQFTKVAIALFAPTVLAAPAASPVDLDESPATTTVMIDFPTGVAGGPVPQDCCFKWSKHGVNWGCGKFCD